ncbi:hypothetical protein PoB_004320500 [Plakobranchus ocellatus]|uniref:Uncharacterized protein n=1 Tax=Plakobranchus ocellatus TaxID=259542 RepID=A0AAV4BAX9_9GAST|nr:hypothetical protein PoB_004320500 [Plakobranchus ocellatus]
MHRPHLGSSIRTGTRQIKDIKKLNSSVILAKAKEIFQQTQSKWCAYQPTTTENCTLCSHRYSLARGCIKRKTTTADSTERHHTLQENTHSTTGPTDTDNLYDEHHDQPCTSSSLDEGPNNVLTQNHDIATTELHSTSTHNTDISTNTFPSDETDTFNTSLNSTFIATCTSFYSNTNSRPTIQPSPIPVAESTPIKPTQTKDSSTSPMVKNEVTFSQSLSLSHDTP